MFDICAAVVVCYVGVVYLPVRCLLVVNVLRLLSVLFAG